MNRPRQKEARLLMVGFSATLARALMAAQEAGLLARGTDA